MIEFKGYISDECIKYILKKEAKVSFFVALIIATIISIPIIILTFLLDWIFIIALPLLVAFPFLAAIPPSPKKIGCVVPNKVVILDDTVICEGEKFSYEKLLFQVKKVVDMGEWYHIEFHISKNPRFICQKDLLTTGTLEEFEKLFESKIVRKSEV